MLSAVLARACSSASMPAVFQHVLARTVLLVKVGVTLQSKDDGKDCSSHVVLGASREEWVGLVALLESINVHSQLAAPACVYIFSTPRDTAKATQVLQCLTPKLSRVRMFQRKIDTSSWSPLIRSFAPKMRSELLNAYNCAPLPVPPSCPPSCLHAQ